jgi:hypothetical protein
MNHSDAVDVVEEQMALFHSAAENAMYIVL